MGGRLGTWQATPTQGPGSRAAGRPHGAGWPGEEGPSAREPEVCRGGGCTGNAQSRPKLKVLEETFSLGSFCAG